jgi:hypothetical protein
VDRSVAQGRPADAAADPAGTPGADGPLDPPLALLGALVLALAALAIYLVTRIDRSYDHFVWQAAAFLEGHAAIRYPVPGDGVLPGNAFFQDVLPVATTDGVPRGLLPFPPLPAILLLPFVAIWGLATDDRLIFTILAAIDVALCWWAIGRLPVSPVVRLATSIFFAFGTVFWFSAQVATAWYQAHIAAVGLTFLAIGLAVGSDRAAVGDAVDDPAAPGADARGASGRPPTRRPPPIDRRQFAAGLLLGLGATARFPVLFGLPFLAFVGGGEGWQGRTWSAGLGAAIPVVALLAFTQVTTGQVVSPAYDYLYRVETAGYPALGYHAGWAIEDPRYLLQNAAIGLFGLPDILPSHLPDALGINPTPVCVQPDAVRGLFDLDCPLALPRDTGMSVVLTSPAYLLAIPALFALRRSRIVAGATVAVVAILGVDLMHFSQGWVQFGYRFSNDAAPFAVLLVALGMQRLGVRRRYGMLLAMSLVVVSLAVNAWGVLWSRALGW